MTPPSTEEEIYIPETKKGVPFRWVALFFLVPATVMTVSLYIVLQNNMRHKSKETLSPAAIEARTMEDASRLYINQCASCHGGQGQGLQGLGISLQQNRLSEKELERVISEGRPVLGMPSFGDRFRPEDIAIMAKYIQGFRETPVPAK